MDARWLEDELNDDEARPYREGNVYICRNCACEMKKRHVLCLSCKKRAKAALRHEQQDQLQEESDAS